MNLTRRDLAVAGLFALTATTLVRRAMAATGDEEAVRQAVEALRKAILTQDKAMLLFVVPMKTHWRGSPATGAVKKCVHQIEMSLFVPFRDVTPLA